VRIVLVIFSLGPGGAERVASTLANSWARSGDQITLVSLESTAKDFYMLESSVRRLALEMGYGGKDWGEFPSLSQRRCNWRGFVVNNVRRVKALRAVFRSCEFDVVLSFGDKINILTLLATLRLQLPVVVAEHNDPTKHSIGVTATWLRRLLYPRARTVVVLTQGIGAWAKRIVKPAAVRVIPNPLDEQFLGGFGSDGEKNGQSVMAMGRMEPQKGFDLLLRAFAQCVDGHPGWSLRIFGQGNEQCHLRALADELGIGAKVQFNPVIKEPQKALRGSDLFVLSSRYEGFPMALLEAMACGLPVISFDCKSGPAEMIRDGVNGILVPPGDVRALANAMNRLMENEQERRRLGARAVEVAERFSLSRVNAMWKNVFDEALS
jgi:GalNAc-alpha-(1->4)-GalNAc-alpha-(1->3)-diNAcBac-PP-undecaprenol alpha-1,4-N-acetyl-D-galactosaminyltransferase